MSSNPFDLERAIDQLKTETPRAEATRQARQCLIKPKQTKTRPRAIAFAAVAVAAAVLLWPRGATGAAWAQVAAKTGRQTKIHTRTYYAGRSDLYSEVWADGPKFAATMYMPHGKGNRLAVWSRNDGVYDITYSNFGGKMNRPRYARKSKVKPSTFYYGMAMSTLGGDSNLIDEVIKKAGWKVQEQKAGVETQQGIRDRYKLKQTIGKWTRQVTVYVDPETKLIRRIDIDVQTMLIDYPEEIPADTFKVEPPPGVEVLDWDKEREDLNATLKRGLGKKRVAGKTVVLRAVMQDLSGNVWVLWTGAGAPAGDLRYPIKVKGFEKGPVYGIKAFTVHGAKPAPVVGQHLGGMAITVGKNLDKATVTVPVLDATGKKKLGSATFENVPVWPIQSIYDFGQELGQR